MPRIQSDPSFLECPDFASPVYAAARAPLINLTTTEDQAIQFLKDIWDVGNQADRIRWHQQIDDDNDALAEHNQIQSEAELLRVQTKIADAEALHKEEMKKNKVKYTPISDRDLWYYTNADLDDALRSSSTIDDEVMVMLHRPDGSSSWVPSASTRDAIGVLDDKHISWEDFCQAVPRMIVAMEEADWPQDRVTMLAKFWGNLQVHELHSSRDPLDQKTLILYQ
ncbi:hypothetical protein BYT27DRAFT_7039294, partial [Phlegmacium glaucopus]